MSLELPPKPNLEYLHKQAKALLRKAPQDDWKLADAQHALARDYGFASWAKLKDHVEALARQRRPDEMLEAAIRASDAGKAAQVLETWPELKSRLDEPMPDYGAGMPAILAAVQRSDRRTIDVLLRAGAQINARSRWWAGSVGVLDECSPEMAPFLMERGATPDAVAAARLGLTAQLRELLERDESAPRAKGANGLTPLHAASTAEIANYLLECGAEIDARDTLHESTPAQHMLRVVQARHYPHDRQPIARFLVERGCRTDLFMAAALGDARLAARILDAGPDAIRLRADDAHFPKQDERSGGTIYIQIFGPGATPHLAARDFHHEDVFRLLMERSPDDVKLAQACELGDEGLFRAMLAARPNLVETLTAEEQRRLPDVAQANNTAGVRLMLQAGWPVDAMGEYDLTALGWAAWHGNAEMVREILKYHPKLEMMNRHEVTILGSALHGSENSWHRETGDYATTVELLIEAGAKAPRVTDDLEASPAAHEVLLRYEARGS